MHKWNVFLVLALTLGFKRSQQSDEKCNPLPNFKCGTYQNQSLSPDPGTNEYTVYRIHVRFRRYCFILAPDLTFTHLRPIESIGRLEQVKFLYSPGFNPLYESFTINPGSYGQLVTYNVSCPSNHTAFFYVIETDMKEADCSGRCRDQKVVIDKGPDGLSNEMCGNDTASIPGHLEQSSFQVNYRTIASTEFRGFRSAVVCHREQQLDYSDCTDVNESFQFNLLEKLSDLVTFGRRSAVSMKKLLSSSQVVVPALQLEHACHPVLRTVAMATLESAYSHSVEKIRSSIPIVVGFLNNSYAVSESEGVVLLQIGILRGPLRTNVTLNFSTRDSTALVDVDYRGVTNHKVPLSNSTSFPVSIKVPLINGRSRSRKGTTVFTVRLTLATPSNSVLLAPANAEVSVYDDHSSKHGKPLTLPVFAIAVIAVVGAIAVILLVVIFTACVVVCIRKKTPPKEEEDLYDVPESPPPPPSSPHIITLPMSRNVRRLLMASNIAYGISSRK